jgi:hypothetical protein
VAKQREVYFHEDDFCQQQLLPRDAADFVRKELRAISDFSDEHRAPDGMGWTEMYIRGEAPAELPLLRIEKEKLGSYVSPFLPPFDAVFTGYSSHREQCEKTGAWGTSAQCALFANWNDDGIIQSVWAEFLKDDEESIHAATRAIATLGMHYPLVYVDWARGYVCDANDSGSFSSLLRSKLAQ